MLDHIFLSVSAIARSSGFYAADLVLLGTHGLDPDGYSLEFVFKHGQRVQ